MTQNQRYLIRCTLGSVVAVAVVGAAGVWLYRWLSGPICGNTPHELFEGILVRPVPDGITDIQGVGDTWQSHTVWLRFRVTDTALAALLSEGFVPTVWPPVATHFRLPPCYDRFTPTWSPESVVVKECYSSGRASGWSRVGGSTYLLIDRAAGIVYVHAFGG